MLRLIYNKLLMFVHSVKTNDRAPIDIPARKNDLKCKIPETKS